jgi:hypothetical protein
VRDAVGGKAPSLGVLGRVSRELGAVGVGRAGAFGGRERGPDGRLLAEVAVRCAGVVPPPLSPFTESPER